MRMTSNIFQDSLERLLGPGQAFLPGPPPHLGALASRIGPLDCPFPVTNPHEIRPDLVKIPRSEPLLVVDQPTALWRDTIAKKFGRLTSADAFVYSDEFDMKALQFWADEVITGLSKQLPCGPVESNGALPWIGCERPASPIDFFLGLTLSLQEDFVLMAPRAHAQAFAREENQHAPLCARLLSVCFPSGWAPEEKCDQSLFAIHHPVADNHRIQAAAASLSIAMAQKGPFVRYVYTLAPDGTLWRDPGQSLWPDISGLADIWFRVERQITIPLAGLGSLFLIRLFVSPLEEILRTPGRAQLLADALETMSPALLSYKGLDRVAPKIIGVLRAHAASDRPPLRHSQP